MSAKPTKATKYAVLSKDTTCRYTLTRWWETEKDDGRVLWFGTNPSRADHLVDDPTVKRVGWFTWAWGYGGFDLVNFLPFRSPDPQESREWFRKLGRNPAAHPDIMMNFHWIGRLIKEANMVVMAHGSQPWMQDYQEMVIDWIFHHHPKLIMYCIGTTNDGSPKHPLVRGLHRVGYDVDPIEWRRGREHKPLKRRGWK